MKARGIVARCCGLRALSVVNNYLRLPEPDPFIQNIVTSWPNDTATPRALAMGFRPDASMDEIV